MPHKKNVLIIQESIPNYRVSFFNKLSESENKNFKVLYSINNQTGLDSNTLHKNLFLRFGKSLSFFNRRIVINPKLIFLDLKNIDVIVLSSNFRNFTFLFLFFKCLMNRNIKIVLWGHFKSTSFFGFFRKFLYRYSDIVLFYTVCEHQEFISSNFVAKRSSFVSNGLDFNKIQDFNIKKKTTSYNEIAFLGRVTDKSELFNYVTSIFFKDLNCTTLNIIGFAPEEVIKYVNSLNLNFTVVFHGVLTNESVIADILSRCRLTFYPGSVGLSLLHSLSYGLPAIIHNKFDLHMPEVCCLCDHDYQFLYNYGNYENLTFIINSTLKNEFSLFEKNKLKNIVSSSYTTDAMACNLNDAIDSLYI